MAYIMKIPSTKECVALIMRTIICDSSETVARIVRDAALTEGVLLRHLTDAMFALSPEKRFVSRYLVSLWMGGGHEPAISLLERTVPRGLRHFLTLGPASRADVAKFESQELDADMSHNVDANQGKLQQRLQKRAERRVDRLQLLRDRIKQQAKNGESAISSK